MSCNGCDHDSQLILKDSGIYMSPLTGASRTSSTGESIVKVNSVNPGASTSTDPPGPYTTYPIGSYGDDNTGPIPFATLVNDSNSAQTVSMTITRIYLEGWNGSCGPDGNGGCQGTDDCTYRIYFDLVIEAAESFYLGEKRPTAPPLPGSLTLAAPNGEVVNPGTQPSPTTSSTGPTPNGSGTLLARAVSGGFTDEQGRPLWESVRIFPYQVVWTVSPKCPVASDDVLGPIVTFGFDLANFVFLAAGWTAVDPLEAGDEVLTFDASCSYCDATTPTTTGQDGGKNANPNSITNTNQQL